MILAIYLTAASLFGLALMGIDKHRAKTRRWRISEKMLFLTAALGGSVGRHVSVPPQDEAFVLCPGDSSDSYRTDGACDFHAPEIDVYSQRRPVPAPHLTK